MLTQTLYSAARDCSRGVIAACAVAFAPFSAQAGSPFVSTVQSCHAVALSASALTVERRGLALARQILHDPLFGLVTST